MIRTWRTTGRAKLGFLTGCVFALACAAAYGQATSQNTTTQHAAFSANNTCNGDKVDGEGTRTTHVKFNQNQTMVSSSHNGQGLGIPTGLKYSFGQKTVDHARSTSSFLVFRNRVRLVNETTAENFFSMVAVKVHKDGRSEGSMEPVIECRG